MRRLIRQLLDLYPSGCYSIMLLGKVLMLNLVVETAFLYGDMNETVYLQQPQGFVPKGQENKVCLLKKAIYGLKRGSRNWNMKLDHTLKKMNLLQSQYDSCVYSFYSTHKCIVIGCL